MGAVERYQPPAVERLEVPVVKAIANTDLIPKPLRGNVPAIMATILKGRALGLDDMHALTAIHFIEGKPTLSAETMVMLVRRAGHSILGDYGDGAVTAKGRRADNGDEMSVTWTIQMATRAKLTGKDNWAKYPEAMLWARAVSQLCRMLFADVLAGIGYTPEELELSPEEQVSEAIGQVGPPADPGEPDDTLRGEAPPTNQTDEPDVVDVEAALVDESEEEPEAAQASPSADAAAAPAAEAPPPSEPGSSSDIPSTDDGAQGSIFASMAEQAMSKREHRDPA